jgi:hypothetical protein
MSENENFGFGKFVPGFDFLQNLAKGASQTLPQMPNLSSWVAPTLNLEELDKRIGELKAVYFWLDQNSKALGATIQALEVQKMTLATLKGMNFSMGEVANALQLKAADAMGHPSSKAKSSDSHAADASAAASSGAEPAAAPAAPSKTKAGRKSTAAEGNKPATGVVDPLQWWGALTQQFQEIAAGAMKDAGAQVAAGSGEQAGTGAGASPRKGGVKRAAKKAAKKAAR